MKTNQKGTADRPRAAKVAAAGGTNHPFAGMSAAGAHAIAAEVEAAFADLEREHRGGFGPAERVLRARIQEAAAQLVSAAVQMEGEQLMVAGSTGQRRHNPLLKLEQDLRREISDGIEKLGFRVANRAMLARMKALNDEAGLLPPWSPPKKADGASDEAAAAAGKEKT